MNVDVILAKVLELAASLDGAIEAGVPCEEDHVYALAGLVLELDGWLAAGRRPPERWARAAPTDGALLVLGADAASNEVAPRRRHGPVRRRRAAVATAQLALPFHASV